MRFKAFFVITVTIVRSAIDCNAQALERNLFSLGVWNLKSITGDVQLGALYGKGDFESYGLNSYIKTTAYYGGLQLRTNSYIWHPNFLTIGIDGGYFPSTNRNEALVIQSRHDVINTRNLGFNTVLFPKKAISLSTQAGFSESYTSRENLTDIKTENKNLGTTLSYRNRYFPLTLAYYQTETNQTETQSDRGFLWKQDNLDARTSRSFGKRDLNELRYNRRDFLRKDNAFAAVRNIIDNAELRNTYFFDSAKSNTVSSSIGGINQRGIDSFLQLRVTENLSYRILRNYSMNCGYNFNYISYPNQNFRQHNANINLGRQFYQSLYTGVNGSYNNDLQTNYRLRLSNVGANIVYNKKIITKGMLSLSYSYNRLHQQRESADMFLEILNELYVLTDNQIVTLKLPYVNEGNILVRDATGSIVYRENLDYVFIRRNNYLEIRRIPGGLIENNTTVYISYYATQPGNNQFDANTRNFSADVAFFRRLFSVYYRLFNTDYVNLKNADESFLNYLNYVTYGIRSDYKIFSGGVEIEDFQSSLFPHQTIRYYVGIQGNHQNKFMYSLNANKRTFYRLPGNEPNRDYYDMNGTLAYAISDKTRLDFNAVYTKQEGRQIDLDLVTGRIKLTTLVRDVNLTAGIETFHREYLKEQKYKYLGGYIQIKKTFKY